MVLVVTLFRILVWKEHFWQPVTFAGIEELKTHFCKLSYFLSASMPYILHLLLPNSKLLQIFWNCVLLYMYH